MGFCLEGSLPRVARAALHLWEEPCICGGAGSGAVFFSGCSLGCVFCQNHSITDKKSLHPGKVITSERLSEIFLELQEKGACNINLITPTHFIPHLIPALQRAKSQGLFLPVVYNTGGYEKTEILQKLEGLVDIYLPDLKYVSSRLSARYSQAGDYFRHASAAIAEMFRQTGTLRWDPESGLLKRGVIVRHMMLPRHLADSKRVVNYLYQTYGNRILLSMLSQYTPVQSHPDLPELNRRVSHKEYHALIDYCLSLGIENAYIQEGDAAMESFIPIFDGEGV